MHVRQTLHILDGYLSVCISSSCKNIVCVMFDTKHFLLVSETCIIFINKRHLLL